MSALRAIAAVCFLACVASCGGEDDGQTGMALELQRSELVAGVTYVRVDVHTGDRKCQPIRDSGPVIDPSYFLELELGDAAKDRGQGEITMIVEGDYTVVVWGFAAKGLAPLAFGCAEEVRIDNGKRTRVSLRIVPFTPN